MGKHSSNINKTNNYLLTQTTEHKKRQQDEFENTKGVIIIRKSKKDWQHNGQQKNKKTDNILQNTTQKTKGRATRTPLKASGELRCSARVGSSCFIGGTRRVALMALEIQVLVRDRDMWMASTGFTIKHVLNVCFVLFYIYIVDLNTHYHIHCCWVNFCAFLLIPTKYCKLYCQFHIFLRVRLSQIINDIIYYQ